MAAKVREVFGLTIVKAPGGNFVLVSGPIDLSRSESLSPAWTRAKMQTRPTSVKPAPSKHNENPRAVIIPVWTKVGEERVHGEAPQRVAARANKELAILMNLAIEGGEMDLPTLEHMQKEPEPAPKKRTETEHDKRVRAERALGFLGLPDATVRQRLLEMGRAKKDVEAYIKQRSAA